MVRWTSQSVQILLLIWNCYGNRGKENQCAAKNDMVESWTCNICANHVFI